MEEESGWWVLVRGSVRGKVEVRVRVWGLERMLVSSRKGDKRWLGLGVGLWLGVKGLRVLPNVNPISTPSPTSLTTLPKPPPPAFPYHYSPTLFPTVLPTFTIPCLPLSSPTPYPLNPSITPAHSTPSLCIPSHCTPHSQTTLPPHFLLKSFPSLPYPHSPKPVLPPLHYPLTSYHTSNLFYTPTLLQTPHHFSSNPHPSFPYSHPIHITPSPVNSLLLPSYTSHSSPHLYSVPTHP